jgi:hypothetical protein
MYHQVPPLSPVQLKSAEISRKKGPNPRNSSQERGEAEKERIFARRRR